MTELALTVILGSGNRVTAPSGGNLANDNSTREQDLFEQCIARELVDDFDLGGK